MSVHHDSNEVSYRVDGDSFWGKRAWALPASLAVVGLVLAVISGVGSTRFGYSYLFGLLFPVTLMLGGLFLVMIEFLTAGHWGVTSRRIAEVMASAAPVVALLAVPLFVGVLSGNFTLYDEWMDAAKHSEHGADSSHGEAPEAHHEAPAPEAHHEAPAPEAHGDEHHAEATVGEHTPQEVRLHHNVLGKKVAYLNPTGWAIRAAVYFSVWIFLALTYFRWSRKSDETKDLKYTNKSQSFAPFGLVLFGLSLTFAMFDWVMSLEPSWYSTIFAVIVFASCAVSSLATVILISLSFFKRGVTGNAINKEHIHDLTKLMFGFICFWTYTQFSQWMLIWYAGIPEEALWFHKRWHFGWQPVSLLLMFGHFVFPFLALISRVQKLNFSWLRIMCFWMLGMHVVDMYWFVLPQAGAFQIALSDIGCLLFSAGVFFAYVFWKFSTVPLIPIGDPRLARSLHHHQSH